VQRGTLKPGAVLVAGKAHGKVRQMLDENQKIVSSAEPSTAVEVTGWREVPTAGDVVLQVGDENLAKRISDHRIRREKITEELEAAKLVRLRYIHNIEENMKVRILQLNFPPTDFPLPSFTSPFQWRTIVYIEEEEEKKKKKKRKRSLEKTKSKGLFRRRQNLKEKLTCRTIRIHMSFVL